MWLKIPYLYCMLVVFADVFLVGLTEKKKIFYHKFVMLKNHTGYARKSLEQTCLNSSIAIFSKSLQH